MLRLILITFLLSSCSYNDDLMAEYPQNNFDDGVSVQSSYSYRNDNSKVTSSRQVKRKKNKMDEKEDDEEEVEIESSANAKPTKINNQVIASSNNVEANPNVYVVQPKDTLYSISRKYGIEISQLASVNNIDSSYQIKIGQKLTIPQNAVLNNDLPPQQVKIVPDANKNPIKTNAGLQTYLVQPKDTIYSIARKYGVHPKSIQQVNNIDDSYILKIGSSIYLPLQVNATGQEAQNITPPANQVNTLPANEQFVVPVATPPVIVAEPKPELTKAEKPENENYKYPVSSKIVSTFGKKSKGLYNDGLLFDVSKQMSVSAAKSGVVIYASYLKNYNNLVIIRHSDDMVSVYGNLDKITVQKNQQVSGGQAIGQLSPSVSKTFYFAIRHNSGGQKPVDPMKFLSK
jgi:murein DD-endopeptidase MepM/ murein hydrolase activator NlpD